MVEAAEDVAGLLESLGHQLEEARPDIDAGALKHATLIIVASNTAHVLHSRGSLVGRPAQDEVESITSQWGAAADKFTGRELAWAIGVIHGVSRKLGRFFENYDVLLTPTCAAPPLPVGTIDMGSTDLDAFYDDLYGYNTFLSIYNCAGIPAASIPLVWHNMVPVGVQLAARIGADDILLRLAAQLEEARPWAHHRPSI